MTNETYKIRQHKSRRLWNRNQRFYYTIEDGRNGEILVHSEMLTKQNMEIASQRFARNLMGATLYGLNERLINLDW